MVEVTRGVEVRVSPVVGRRDLRRFLRFPWRVYEGDPAWVPPLLGTQKTILDRRKHPFHHHAQVEYFLARRGSDVVGRIAAFVNLRYNEIHGSGTGFFGFFEVLDDPPATAALLDMAQSWVSDRGASSLVGPMNFSTNDESHCPGILLDGFDEPPFVLMGHGRPYYRRLLEGAGFTKAHDLLAFLFPTNRPPARLVQTLARVERGIEGLQVRPVDMARFEDEVAIVQGIYNKAWQENWGYVPLTSEEIAHLAKELKPIIEPRYALLAFVKGEPAGFSLTLPDFNQALRHANGRLWPLGLLKILRQAKRIDRARVFALGLDPRFRRSGIDAVLYMKAFEAAQSLGHRTAESSWILEGNRRMRRALEKMGAHVYKTYRVFQRTRGAS